MKRVDGKASREQSRKSSNQTEKPQKWNEHFKNLLGKPSEISEKPTEQTIKSQLDMKEEHFTEEEL